MQAPRQNTEAPKAPILFHPDFNRRPRNFTDVCCHPARGRSRAITAGGEFRPALRMPDQPGGMNVAKPERQIKPKTHGSEQAKAAPLHIYTNLLPPEQARSVWALKHARERAIGV